MPAPKRFIVSVTNDLYTDQRVHKVCLYLRSKGHEVWLVGRKRKSSVPLAPREYRTIRLKLLFEKGALFYAAYNIRLFFFLLFRRFDVLVANDLDSLAANYLASVLRRKPLVYDTHEYFTEVPELVHRPRIKAVWERIEKFIFPKLKRVYTVNESIAALYHEKYKIPVQVVRNLPLKKKENQDPPSRETYGIPPHTRLIVIQGAGLNIDRGNEEMLEAMRYLDNALLLIIGQGDVLPLLKESARDPELKDKVRFMGRMPYTELSGITQLADVGITLDKDTNLNYRYSLPNKLFDFIQCGVPVVASDLPEVKKIVLAYEVGIIVPSHDPKVIAEEISRLLQDKVKWERLKKNTSTAAKALHWEKETLVLDQIYEGLH